ncbi:hypothetical protein CHARACLAT_003208 [Characodon lateralis]|uniref:Uncharacterized protein n=1 Tax=Characodon lateralis TaxID=208331 RepID=A0ABU7DZA7_9TELE|nr:hypothetical protein [Characodon lateralis]
MTLEAPPPAVNGNKTVHAKYSEVSSRVKQCIPGTVNGKEASVNSKVFNLVEITLYRSVKSFHTKQTLYTLPLSSQNKNSSHKAGSIKLSNNIWYTEGLGFC